MGKKNKAEEKVVEAQAGQPAELTPYDNLYGQKENFKEESQQKQESKQINLSFSVNSLSSILAIFSLCLTFIFAVIACFGVNVWGVTRGIFFLLTSILAVASVVFAYKNSSNKMNMPLAFSVLTVLITVIVYV